MVMAELSVERGWEGRRHHYLFFFQLFVVIFWFESNSSVGHTVSLSQFYSCWCYFFDVYFPLMLPRLSWYTSALKKSAKCISKAMLPMLPWNTFVVLHSL